MRRLFCILFAFGLLSAGVLIISSTSVAGTCLPGLPCVTNFTPNPTPLDPTDGPNASGAPNANKNDIGSCDADFMNQIHARAFLEANRELLISELKVTKPDSVLEYTCFDQSVADTYNFAAPLFTKSEAWSSSGSGVYSTIVNPGASDIDINVFMGSNRMEDSLNELVMKSLYEFVDKNFAHDFLGGTAVGDNNSIADEVTGVNSTCTFMNDIFFLAKCVNINPAVDFMKLSEMVTSDPRETLPTDLRCGAINPITADILAVANNDSGTYSFKEDTVIYLNFLDATSCEDPIPTGLQITRQRFNIAASGTITPASTQNFEDHVCANPGCFYDWPGGTCKTSP